MLRLIRSLDMFGVPISLKMNGETTFATTGGGLLSMALRVFFMSFFLMQLIAVLEYTDPQISSFTVLDTRQDMESPVTLDEYGF